MDENGTWHMELGIGSGHIVLHEDPAPLSKKGSETTFGPVLLWPNGCKHQYANWYGGRPRPTHRGIDGDPAAIPVKGHNPLYSANVRSGQTAVWTKMPLGMEVRLGPGSGDLVFDGDPATRRENGTPIPPNFWPMCIVAKRLHGSS